MPVFSGISTSKVWNPRVRTSPVSGWARVSRTTPRTSIQALTPEWDIQIVPPPETPVLLGAEADAAARKANDELLGWAATRVGLPLKLDGDGARAEEIREALRAQNVIFINGDERAPLRLSWVLATQEE